MIQETDYDHLAEIKRRKLLLEIPQVMKPSEPNVEMCGKNGFPALVFPTNLDEYTPRQLMKELSLWTAWALYSNYQLSLAFVDELIAEDIYEYYKRKAMNMVDNDVKKDLVEARAELAYPDVKDYRRKFVQAKAWRILLGGHIHSKDNPGGLTGTFRRGVDTISRAVELKKMDLEVERTQGKYS